DRALAAGPAGVPQVPGRADVRAGPGIPRLRGRPPALRGARGHSHPADRRGAPAGSRRGRL
ncbi:MAG: FIG002473: Protein YcaR in KDO2-Lipid A biosynthesis cluster, partial [uncultured Gemmatimonadetes bacterium]